MTRGTLLCLCDTLIIESIEFNGDMMPDSLGQDVIKALEELETANEFRIFVEKFNKENHNYQDIESLTFPRKRDYYMKGDKVIMTEDDYFSKFGSDWTFWKNISDKTVKISTREGKIIALKPMEQVAINYGHIERHYKSLAECEVIIKKEDEERKKAEEQRAKEVKKVSLYFKSGTSDKEYHLQLNKEGNGFVVNFQYGRRGSNLKEGTKTPIPVEENRAIYIFNEIEKEKLRKGYR